MSENYDNDITPLDVTEDYAMTTLDLTVAANDRAEEETLDTDDHEDEATVCHLDARKIRVAVALAEGKT
jgi:hypothetical protein